MILVSGGGEADLLQSDNGIMGGSSVASKTNPGHLVIKGIPPGWFMVGIREVKQ